MLFVTFTKLEAEALRHRLDAADCIADVFADTPELAAYDPTAVESCARRLSDDLSTGFLVLHTADPLTREVLTEAVEGSTWNGVHYADEVSPQRRASAARALQSAADKIAAAFGLETLCVPEG